MADHIFPGFDVKVVLENGDEYTTSIQKVSLGVDILSTIPSASIQYNVSVEKEKILLTKHKCVLTIKNKMVVGDIPEETFTIDLTSVGQKSELIRGKPMRTDELEKVNLRIKYMDSECLKVINSRVGGLYENKTLSQIIKDLYNQTGSQIPIKMDPPDGAGGGGG